jgi:hypothetical protein
VGRKEFFAQKRQNYTIISKVLDFLGEWFMSARNIREKMIEEKGKSMPQEEKKPSFSQAAADECRKALSHQILHFGGDHQQYDVEKHWNSALAFIEVSATVKNPSIPEETSRILYESAYAILSGLKPIIFDPLIPKHVRLEAVQALGIFAMKIDATQEVKPKLEMLCEQFEWLDNKFKKTLPPSTVEKCQLGLKTLCALGLTALAGAPLIPWLGVVALVAIAGAYIYKKVQSGENRTQAAIELDLTIGSPKPNNRSHP